MSTDSEVSEIKFSVPKHWLEEVKLVFQAVLVVAFVSVRSLSLPLKACQYLLSSSGILRLCIVEVKVRWFTSPRTTRTGELDRPRPRGPTCINPRRQVDLTKRTTIHDTGVFIWGWPSRGGVIILDNATVVDMEFLKLDRLNPPTKKLESQVDEDAFCQRLLLLGAKWLDSEARSFLLDEVREINPNPTLINKLEMEEEPWPTIRERRWVSVGWPTTGGLWVAEFDTNICDGPAEEDNQVPGDTARLILARTMDEKCKILREHFSATFYQDVRQYQGYAFINSWDEKVTGEVGPSVIYGTT
jgi:hypothetical protein